MEEIQQIPSYNIKEMEISHTKSLEKNACTMIACAKMSE